MQDRINNWLSWFLLLSIFLSVIVVILGASLYLLQEGHQAASYQNLSPHSTTYTAFLPILQDALGLDPSALILLGFLILVFSQVLRVLILGFFFLQTAEYLLALSSFFIFFVLIYSMLWRE